MTTYTTIPDTNLDPGKPTRSIDAKALRDNPIAITEGASGAPRIRTAALYAPEAGTTYIINRIQEGARTTSNSAYLAGDLYKGYDIDRHLGVSVLVAGVITVSVEHRGVSGTGARVRVLKNAALVQEWTDSTGGTFILRQVNVTVAVGDVVVIQQRDQAVSVTSEWQKLRIYSNQPDMAVA